MELAKFSDSLNGLYQDPKKSTIQAFYSYQQAEQIAVDKVGWLPIFYPKLNVLIKTDIEGIVLNGGGIAVPDYTRLKGH